jgi:hypothetical protein
VVHIVIHACEARQSCHRIQFRRSEGEIEALVFAFERQCGLLDAMRSTVDQGMAIIVLLRLRLAEPRCASSLKGG